MKKHVPIWIVVVVALLVAAVAGYYFGIRPKRQDVEKLDARIAELEIQIEAAQRLAAQPQDEEPGVAIRIADLVKLAKAMPDDADMAGVILELNAAATAAGVEFAAIQPGNAVPGNGSTQIPISLTFEGTYYELTQLLFSLRNLVTVREGILDADGRLFSVDGLDLQEGTDGFPYVKALLTVTAYQYGVDPAALAADAATDGAAAQPPESGESGEGGTEGTSTGTTETEPPAATEPPAETEPPAGGEAPQAQPQAQEVTP